MNKLLEESERLLFHSAVTVSESTLLIETVFEINPP